MQFNTKRVFLITAMLASASFGGQCLWAATAIVGTCPGSGTRYLTIQSAVLASSPGTIIKICPGNYPEQIVINKTLSLLGIQSGNMDDPVITSPPGGVVPNTFDLYDGTSPIAAQVLAQNATDVDISNIAVDGSNNFISGCAPDFVGIYYQNASGDLTSVATRNQTLAAGLTGCQSGLGIFVQSGYSSSGRATVDVENSSVRTYQKNGITADGENTNVTIKNNYIAGQGPTTGAAENGIQVSTGAAGWILDNTVIDDIWAPDTSSDPGDAAAGILIVGSERVLVAGNTVGSTQFGIVAETYSGFGSSRNPNGLADYTVITSNHLLNTEIFDAIDACSNANTIEYNNLYSSTESAIHLDSTCGSTGSGNKVQKNIINEGCAGILNGGSSNAISSNGFSNLMFTVLPGDACPVPPVATATSISSLNVRNALHRSARPAPSR